MSKRTYATPIGLVEIRQAMVKVNGKLFYMPLCYFQGSDQRIINKILDIYRQRGDK